MRFAHFFVDRPVFAAVLSIVTVLVGLIAMVNLPIAQYPEIAPPTVVVSARYPGANAQVVSDSIATPIEQQINGVENMLYMSSQCNNDGSLQLTVTFALGTNLDIAQVQVQNRVALAEPQLPEEVRRQGVTVRKSSPDITLVVQLFSPDNTFDRLYLSNFATLQVRDQLARVAGVGDIRVFGARDYAILEGDLSDVLRATQSLAKEQVAGQLGKVISIFSAKGGSGATTVGVNLAAAIASKRQKKVCLIDLNLQLGDSLQQAARMPAGR